jgi:hypothetical protein
VSEVLAGGELFDRVCSKTTYKESQAQRLAKDLLASVAYLHDLGIVHRDLKPEVGMVVDSVCDVAMMGRVRACGAGGELVMSHGVEEVS